MNGYNNELPKRFNDWTSVLQYYELKDETGFEDEDYMKVPVTSKPQSNTIRKIHIYDFDGTLFYTPNIFYDSFTERAVNYIIPFKGLINGGWWCYRESVEAYIKKWLQEKDSIPKTGLSTQSLDKTLDGVCFCESCKIDSKYWCYDTVKQMKASYEDKNTLTIMMTGRRLDRFHSTFELLLKSDIKHRTVFHEELKVDSVFLKKDFKYTIEYKTRVMKDLLINFPLVSEMIMYDDRTDQIKGMNTWMKNNKEKITDIRYTKDTNRPREILFEINVVKPKVGRYESKEQLSLIEGLITRNNKNCFEQQISIDVEIYSDFYIPIQQNDTRFLKGLVDYIVPGSFRENYCKNTVIGIQFLKSVSVDRENPKVVWVVDSVKVCEESVFIIVYNENDIEEKGIIITHSKTDHRNTIKQMKHDIKKDDFNLLFSKEKVTFSLNQQKKVKYPDSQIEGSVDVNRDFQWSNMEVIAGDKLTLIADFTNINNLMLIDLKETED